MAKIFRREKINVRHTRLRKKVSGSPQRPRLSVYFSGRNIYAQIIDDSKGVTLVSANTTESGLRSKEPRANSVTAGSVGKLIAERALKANLDKVVFDRGGFIFHGKVKALAEAARLAGLQF
jgi:large subunit ribosomal protein L18